MKQVVESGHSRFPVHGEDKDEILGILLAKDLLRGVVADNGPRQRARAAAPGGADPRIQDASTCCCASSASRATTWRS